MKKRQPPPAATAAEPKRVAPKRSVEDRLGEAMREVAREDGVEIHGKWDAIADRARERWAKRAATLVRQAAKLKIEIRDAE